MSLFRSDVLGLSLAAGGVAIARAGRCMLLSADHEDWTSGLAVLDGWLAAERPGRARVRLLVSSRHVRTCLVPWPSRRLTDEQLQAWVLLHFETAHGDMQGWQTALDAGTYGQSQLACALPRALVQQWHALCRRHRLADGRLQPYAVAAWNHWRRVVRPGQFWGVAEADRVVWARRGQRGWASVHTARAIVDATTLPVLAAHQLRLQGEEPHATTLLHLPGHIGAPSAVAASSPRWLALSPHEEAAGLAMARLAALA